MTASTKGKTAVEDPSVTSQYDTSTPIGEQISDFYTLVDKQRIGLLITNRDSSIVSRAMAVAKREGPDFWVLANINSNKINDLKTDKKCNYTFFDSGDKSWISVSGSGEVTQDEKKIRELYTPVVSAWFGDLGDGVHTGSADDPRMSAIKIETSEVNYYKTTKSTVGRMADMAIAVGTGRLAQTGVLRRISGDALAGARAK